VLTALAAASALALAAPPAAAPPARGGGTQLLSVWLVLDPGPVDGIGIGGRWMTPLGTGVIRGGRVRDEFTLELGVDLAHYGATAGAPPYTVDYSWNGLLLAIGPTWNFWLAPQFAIYPKLDLGVWIGSYHGWDASYGYTRHDYGGLYLEPAVGVLWRLRPVTLRLELGTELLRLGVGFDV
jgi:hypothetical protein